MAYVGNHPTEDRLREMLVPERNLNPTGFLLQDIFRLMEYRWNSKTKLNDPTEMKLLAFRLRKDLDGCFDDTLNRVFSQPNHNPITGFSGCFCTVSPEHQDMNRPFLYSFPMASVQNMTDTEFSAEMRRLRTGAPGESNNCIAMSFRLASGEPFPTDKWTVHQGGAGFPGHVTVAVSDENGLQAVEDMEDGRMFRIPDLLDMNWQLTGTVYICEGQADWPEDCFPDIEGWRDAVGAFDLIMRYGNLDEYLDIWRVHNMLYGQPVDPTEGYADREMSVPLHLALDTVRAFLYSGAYDPNESNTAVHRALDWLQRAVAE
eukprot:gene19982-20504_t